MKLLVNILLAVYALISVISIACFEGVGDVGDSVSHYLFARYAPVHPELYFDHWAKPLFVLLASPFAQFGFMGMKVFNAIISFITVVLTYRIALRLKLSNAAVIILLMLFSPLWYILTFSGLTEPLFALFTALGIYFCLGRRYLAACLVVSFLPYIRSEGLIIVGVFGLYLLWVRSWKHIPFLLVGSVLYGVAGYFIYHDFLWVFTRIPYATLGSVYGSGPLFHFVEQLINVVGVPIYALVWIGMIAIFIGVVKKRKGPEEGILVLLGFLCFFVAHSLFWYLGIFNSMGLKRVLLGVMPLIAIMALNGFNVIAEGLAKTPRLKTTVIALLLVYMVIFPFTANPSAIHWKKDMMMTEEQKMAFRLKDTVLKLGPVSGPMIYDHQYLSLVFGLDHFDESKRLSLTPDHIQALKTGGMVIWENQFAEEKSGMKKEHLDADPRLTRRYTWEIDDFGKRIEYAVYTKN
jgi:hypothetical protein